MNRAVFELSSDLVFQKLRNDDVKFYRLEFFLTEAKRIFFFFLAVSNFRAARHET